MEPLLQMLQRQGLWKYVRRNAATAEELFYWMSNEWDRCAKGSVLYFATHGDSGAIQLGNEPIPIEELAKRLDCRARLVHFSGCSTLACGGTSIRRFMDQSGAMAVSGYCKSVGWTSSSGPVGKSSPAALCDLMLLSVMAEKRISLTDGRSRGRSIRDLLELKENLRKRFYDCEFDLHLKCLK